MAIDVTIVRPTRPLADRWGMTLAAWSTLFLSAWIIMLILPVTVFNIAPGYWTTFATLLVIRAAWGGKSGYLWWTKDPDAATGD